MRLLALDFDGVISDSAPEALVVALLAWRSLRPETGLARAVESLQWAGRSEIVADPLYDLFVDLMPLGNNALDYAVILDAIESGKHPTSQDEYDLHRAGVDPRLLEAYPSRFYETRWAMTEERGAAWLDLMVPYPEIAEMLVRRSGDALLCIATAKDRRTVDRLLQRDGLDRVFAPNRIVDKEAGRSKRAHLAALSSRTGVAFEEIFFVDDKLNHLEDVVELGVETGLAGWGYNGARERDAARAAGHVVLDPGRVEAQLFGS